MKVDVTIMDIQLMARDTHRLIGMEEEKLMELFLTLLEDTTLPLDLSKLVEKCMEYGYDKLNCGIVVSVIAGFMVSRCMITDKCKLVVEPKTK